MKFDSLTHVFAEQLSDLRSAERQQIVVLPQLVVAATDTDLKSMLSHHLEHTRRHLDRIEDIIGAWSRVPDEESLAMRGPIAEVKIMLAARAASSAKDAELIAAAQRIEHYEIAVYGTARALARQCLMLVAAQMLDDTLDDESDFDKRLTKLATGGFFRAGINEQAE